MSPFYRVGIGKTPQPGDTCVVHWAGRTKNYQAKRIDNTSLRDEPYRFVLGAHAAIPAFEEAVAGMRAGGLRRVEVPGERPELSYPRGRRERFESGFRCGGVGFGARRRMRGCNLCRQMRGCAVPQTHPPPPRRPGFPQVPLRPATQGAWWAARSGLCSRQRDPSADQQVSTAYPLSARCWSTPSLPHNRSEGSAVESAALRL